MTHSADGAVQGPADYQRKMAGRMHWPKPEITIVDSSPVPLPDAVPDELADYPLNTFLTLSLSASDSEGAVKHSPGKAASNLDLLQQLIHLAQEEETFEKCKHPLHSWMCEQNKTNQIQNPQGASSELRQEFSAKSTRLPSDGNFLLPEKAPTAVDKSLSKESSPRPKKDGWHGADPCTHPFHSWLCSRTRGDNNPQRQAEPSKNEEVVIVPAASTTPVPPSTTSLAPITARTTMSKSGWEGADPCTHPFHSWLCNPAPKAKFTTAPATTTRQPFVPEAADNSFVPDIIPVPSTTTRPPPMLIRTIMPKPGWDEADSCSHPFHSWLCANPSKAKSTTAATTPPPSSTTTPALRVPEASNVQPAQIRPLVKSSGWEGADPCSHPFHSWLCNRARKGRQSQQDFTRSFQWDPQRVNVRPASFSPP